MSPKRRNSLSSREETRLSKLMALVLRHQPDRVDVELDEHGAVDIDELADAIGEMPGWEFLRPEHIVQVVEGCPRERFKIDQDNHTVRASYGHSLPEMVVYEPAVPPAKLYHGSSPHDASDIQSQGLYPLDRQYVHLSVTARLAYEVGSRHDDEPVVMVIDAAAAHADGVEFYHATDDIWLVKHLPAEYLVEWDKQADNGNEEFDEDEEFEDDVEFEDDDTEDED